jgi:hypothetical protein
MSASARAVLAQSRLTSDPRDYVLVALPPQAITAAAGVLAECGEPFAALIADKDEVTLVLLAEAWPDFAGRLPGHQLAGDHYRLITFDIELEISLVGFMALVSTALADAGVSILPLAAFTRDHILVKAQDCDKALNTLQHLQASLQSS